MFPGNIPKLARDCAPGDNPSMGTAKAVVLAVGIAALSGGGAVAAEPPVPVPDSYGEAIRWYRAAADAGDPRAQFYLGVRLEQGIEGTPDPEAAAEWFGRAAEQGHTAAQLKLAGLLYRGDGVDRDRARAAEWYRQAADGGSPRAAFNLGLMAERGDGLPRDAELAASMFEQAADGGVAAARLKLAVIYATGVGVDADPVEALTWMRLAEMAGQPVPDAVRRLLRDGATEAEAEAAEDRARLRHRELPTAPPPLEP